MYFQGNELFLSEILNDALSFQEQHVDLVVTDLIMPDMGGLEVISLIRKQNTAVPIVAVSGAQESLRKSMKMGATAVLYKPYTDDGLISSTKAFFKDITSA